MRKGQIGLLISIIYVVAVMYVHMHNLYGYLHALTFPWSPVFELIADYYHIHTDSFKLASIIISTICNASILYLLCTVFGRKND
jgi:hypothetical protein